MHFYPATFEWSLELSETVSLIRLRSRCIVQLFPDTFGPHNFNNILYYA